MVLFFCLLLHCLAVRISLRFHIFCVRGTRTQPLICVGFSVHYWVSCAINEGGFFEIAFVVVVDTHLPRFEALDFVLPHFDALTHVVILVSSAFIFQTFAEVCYSVFVTRSSFNSVLNLRKTYIFKTLLKVYYRSVFAESFKTFIFQKFRRPLCHKVNLPTCVARRPLCHKVNLPRCKARRRHFVMPCDIFGTGQTNILGLCYLFGKTYKQPTVAPLKSLKSTHSTKSRQHLLQLIETEHTISLAFKAFS